MFSWKYSVGGAGGRCGDRTSVSKCKIKLVWRREKKTENKRKMQQQNDKINKRHSIYAESLKQYPRLNVKWNESNRNESNPIEWHRIVTYVTRQSEWIGMECDKRRHIEIIAIFRGCECAFGILFKWRRQDHSACLPACLPGCIHSSINYDWRVSMLISAKHYADVVRTWL